jgi:hypothetical protein
MCSNAEVVSYSEWGLCEIFDVLVSDESLILRIKIFDVLISDESLILRIKIFDVLLSDEPLISRIKVCIEACYKCI